VGGSEPDPLAHDEIGGSSILDLSLERRISHGDTVDADDVFQAEVRRWRGESWERLSQRVNSVDAYEVEGRDGTRYQFEVDVLWDDRVRGDLRVIVTGDDAGGWRTHGMRSEDFIKAPDGSFIGE